ncbi:Na(+)/H(+) antiporter subunit F1 [Cytobacillus oceanisediminis]|jgi:multicomponent Na+:H+ antiporter subunit F|uniref:Na(+)/H(+) antiporter subunit F1 n=2 Tax=Niallia TaxID=2837506 RepID=A0A941JKM4_NIACI|nr:MULTISPECIES: Na(+)/H(+) antiporter subunit F1 [Bacillaceae]EOR25676.1 multisubunit Na+/H+ antiporter subunit MnhF [Niallia nealsonii AAU1]MDU1844722.1 Na(+)/H(+) antiporter subunit F1 [Niallia nealsonii]MBZ9534627.1 Na(+)/H(+) antiporter subunit F1 [Cytobacillus oceanisediminis]MCB5236484.1 Na(+)/H(+) antiporter subunit F1 [Niallia circulans]MED3793983.1 Na(+)/H(+) antiporter subunit F1 [Niallia alba]
MIDNLLVGSLILLILSILATVYRLVKGPSAPDRIQALDSLGINLIAGVAIFSVLLRNTGFFEVILLIGILSFIGTIAFARYIERGVVIERKQSD